MPTSAFLGSTAGTASRGEGARANLLFTSVLAADYKEALERLLYFNPEQKRFRPGILRSIERCGYPEIVTRNGQLHIGVGKCPDAQNLHALEPGLPQPRLAGSIIHFRESRDNLVVAHIAVAPRPAKPVHGEVPLAFQLLHQVMLIARRVKGIETVEMLYSHGKSSRIPIADGLEWIALKEPPGRPRVV